MQVLGEAQPVAGVKAGRRDADRHHSHQPEARLAGREELPDREVSGGGNGGAG